MKITQCKLQSRSWLKPQLKLQQKLQLKLQKGYLLIETLITVGILAVGLLGVAAMQATSLKSSYSAMQRGEAAILLAAMSDRMRANPKAFFNKASVSDIEYNALPTGSRAKTDLAIWKQDIDAIFGTDAQGNPVAVGSVNCVTKVNCILQVSWNDSRADTALNPDEASRTPAANTYRYKHVVSVIF